MAHEGLQRSCIDSLGRRGVASRMPQHVRIDPKAAAAESNIF
jgi:hypothetical protein